jgi:diguanylate cyclase (GGDEF)-like protein
MANARVATLWPGRLRGWELWTVPRPALSVVLLIDLTAIAALVVLLRNEPVQLHTATRFVEILVLAVLFTEATDRIDRVRRYVGPGVTGSGITVGPVSVWSVAAAITLPPGWTALLVAALFAHALGRNGRSRSAHPHRLFLSGASLLIAAAAGARAVADIDSWTWLSPEARHIVGVIAAIIVVQLVNYALVYVVVHLVSRPRTRRVRVGSDQFTFEFVTLILGAITGELIIHVPWLTPGVLPILALLYRGSMVTKLQVQSSTDAKTGLLNSKSWRESANQALVRTGRNAQPSALLLVDLDFFKRVNDNHGHLVGDAVLTAVAGAMRTEMRGYDIIGRFGGEEFVLLLDNVDRHAAIAAATRVRERISALETGDDAVRITASIGVAHSPRSTVSLDTLLERADAALYEAKACGRDTVRALTAFAATDEAAA